MTSISFLCFSCLTTFVPVAHAQAKTHSSVPVIVELYRYGQVEKKPSSYQIGEKGGVFLKIEKEGINRCVYIHQPGEYNRDQLTLNFAKQGQLSSFFKCNLRALALRIKSPAQIILIPEPRGDEASELADEQFFESIWQQVVMKKAGEIPLQNLMAAAVWFYKSKKNPTRAAFILEQAHKHYQNDWFLKLHHDAYAETSPAMIEQEVQTTLNAMLSIYSPQDNMALLIGVQNYEEDSGWTNLKTPINDINRLKHILVTKYGFNSNHIYLLPDATYQDLLDAIGDLRQKVNNRTNLLIYYAGHGWIDEDGEYFWIPSDGRRSPKSWIYTDYILKKIRSFDSLHTLFIVDSCFGGALNSHASRGPTDVGVRKLYQKKSRQLITAGGNEPVADTGSSHNSIFAGALLDILENQPEDQPLSVQELFSQLQPTIVASSNQTPTYDRLPNSRDEWGQFYFIQDWKSTLLTPSVDPPKRVESLKKNASFKDDFYESITIPQPIEATQSFNRFQLHRSEEIVTIADILENETFMMLGGSVAFDVNIKNRPLLLQLSYLVHQKQQNTNQAPQSLNRSDFQLGLRSLEPKQKNNWQSEFGIYYNWRRLEIEWDTSNLANKKADKEFIIIGYHLLDIENFAALRLDEALEFGLNYDFQIGLVNFSGSTGIAVSETFNKDAASLILGVNLAPEFRYRIPAISLEFRLGAGVEYLWQPIDNEGGSQTGSSSINSTQKAYHLYSLISLLF